MFLTCYNGNGLILNYVNNRSYIFIRQGKQNHCSIKPGMALTIYFIYHLSGCSKACSYAFEAAILLIVPLETKLQLN